ncbi:MAG: vWA domain-containing protein, partial [Planctomycetota bacterium]
AIEIRQELQEIERLLEQLREAMKNARVARIDMEALARYASEQDLGRLEQLREQIQQLMDAMLREQGIERDGEGYRLSPRAMRTFQGRLLERIFSGLEASRSGRHAGPVLGEGSVETPRTRPWTFGDSAAHLDLPGTIVNAMIRRGGRPASEDGGLHFRGEDMLVHETRNTPRCATSVVMDMSGSMRWSGLYVSCKRMALALEGLIRREYPGDGLQFIEMASFARPVRPADLAALMPKPVTIRHPVVRLKADMSDPDISEMQIPPHFTNIQHALTLSRRYLGGQDTPNRQIVLITDGLPTAHFEDSELYLLYPPHRRTEEATMREAMRCRQEGITINVFLLPTWSQSEEDVQFAHRMAEQTGGRVFFTAGGDLDRFVLWDYVDRRRSIIG